MKKLLLGNEAVARGLYEAGCRVASSYPGTPSTEVTDCIAKYNEITSEWAPNEKVACEVAFGAAVAGARSFCAMKHVGLNVAADPLFTSSYTGVNAGMVIVVADDPGMHSSQNEQDSRHYAKASKIMMLEPADSDECLKYSKAMFKLAQESIEKFGAFVNIQGFRALLPISELSFDRVTDAGDVVEVGQELNVKVIHTDWKNERVSVSLKALLSDPWEDAAAKFPVGTKVDGKISKIMDFGLFVNLDKGIDGLVHISEVAHKRVTNIADELSIGQEVSAKILEIDKDRKRISLSIKETVEAPAEEAVEDAE